jgi:hypothetical protein
MANKRIIRNINELPEWYSLKKYHGIALLDAAKWYDILLQRWTHKFFFERDGIKKYTTYTMDNGENPFLLALQASRENPLSLLEDDLQIIVIGGGLLQELKYDPEDFAVSSYAVSPLTIRRLYQIENRLKKETRFKIRKWMDSVFGFFGEDFDKIPQEEHEWAKSFIDDPIFEALEKHGEEDNIYETGRDYDLVRIDLTVPDKILIQQFADYLYYVRKKYPNVKKAHKYKYPEYQKWIDYAVLPYIDLKLWAYEENCSIPHRVMADAIFPDGEKGEEMVRKTTQKIADMLMGKEYVDFLATIAAHEIAEKKSENLFRQK